MALEARKSVSEMLGDTAREAGVLLLVFGLLDVMMESAIRTSGIGQNLFLVLLFTSTGGTFLVALGMYLERLGRR